MCKGNLDSCTQMLLDHLGPYSAAQDTSQECECMEVCGTLVQYINGMIDAAIQSSKGSTEGLTI